MITIESQHKTIADNSQRKILYVSGLEAHGFLQSLVTNNIDQLSNGILYSALLTPQGKYLFDFFLIPEKDRILIDVKATCASALLQRLLNYRLRAKVEFGYANQQVITGVEKPPPKAVADPRHPRLGWRLYGSGLKKQPIVNWNKIRVDHCIPETGIELIPGKTFILETGFARLNGVDFRKGCFVGQEVTARMQHKTTLRKKLTKVLIDSSAPIGTSIDDNGRNVGTLFTQSNGLAIALVRLDRISNHQLKAGDATITLLDAPDMD